MAKKDYVVGSGNVFEDLRYTRPAEALAKAELARKIGALIAKRGFTQAAAAEVLQIDQPKVSALVHGRLAGFSLDRLVRFLVLLGSDVEIIVNWKGRWTKAKRIAGEITIKSGGCTSTEKWTARRLPKPATPG